MRRILHLVGSPVSDFYAELSRLYARDCIAATADVSRYEFHIAHVEPGGRWTFPEDLDDDAIARCDRLSLADAIARIGALDIELMVPQMFCIPGMTHYRSLFDTLGIAYIGNEPAVMAMTADKATARAVVAAAGVRVPEGEVLRVGEDASLAPPVVVKPVDADNSLGVVLVVDPDDYPAALATAWKHSSQALVERFVQLGREVRCGVIERKGQLVALPLEEYAMDHNAKPIRDAADKLRRDDDGEMHLVAKESTRAWIVDLDDPVTARVQEVARRCHRALGCRDYGLFDFRIDPDGAPWFLEASLYCSFARKSVISMMAAASGIELTDLFAGFVDRALTTNRTS